MPALDVCMQLYLLHDPTRYAWMIGPGAPARRHLVHGIPPGGTCSAQQHVCVLLDVIARPYLRGRQTPQERLRATNRPRSTALSVPKLVARLNQRCVPPREVPR